MSTVFADVPAWPGANSDSSPPIGHNQPPLEERLLMEFAEELDRDGITARVQQLLESAAKVPDITDDAIAGKVGDLCKLASDVEKRINATREKHNRPLLNAQRALKAKADGVYAPLQMAIANVRAKLNGYVAEKNRRLEAERRAAEEEARKAREAMQQAGVDEKLVETVAPAPVPSKAPLARGDLGASVGTQKAWCHEIESVRQLPDRILKNARVIEALDKVIAAEIRGGAREIKGCRIWSEDRAVVR